MSKFIKHMHKKNTSFDPHKTEYYLSFCLIDEKAEAGLWEVEFKILVFYILIQLALLWTMLLP